MICSSDAVQDDLSPAMLDFMASNQNSAAEEDPHAHDNLLPSAIPVLAAQHKRKKNNAPLDVNDLRRSRRLAGLSVGFKNEAAAVKAKEWD